LDRLKAINTFMQIARSGNLARAARELGISRSIVSTHLKQLEDHLGILLVKRTTRSVVLTEAGQEYLNACMSVINGLIEAESRLSADQRGASGHLKCMASMAFGMFQLGPMIPEFVASYPQIRMSLILTDRGFAAEDFLEGDFDLGVSMDNMKDASFISTKIGEVQWIPCAGPDYFHNRPPLLTPADLKDHNCLTHRSYAPDSVWKLFGPGGAEEIRVSGSVFTNSSAVLRDSVLRGTGVAMLPRYSVEEDMAESRLVRVLDRYTGVKRPIYLVYHESRFLPKRARLLIDFLKKKIRTLPL
jgi:DNA-binding transcriptional LysR family regulator